MNFKTHAPARREGTTLQQSIHISRSCESEIKREIARWALREYTKFSPRFLLRSPFTHSKPALRKQSKVTDRRRSRRGRRGGTIILHFAPAGDQRAHIALNGRAEPSCKFSIKRKFCRGVCAFYCTSTSRTAFSLRCRMGLGRTNRRWASIVSNCCIGRS